MKGVFGKTKDSLYKGGEMLKNENEIRREWRKHYQKLTSDNKVRYEYSDNTEL